ncbi:MAG: ferrous iron transport protein A [Gammaproteobacteria bacterium]|nr:ferrous iron transport protein A [Gammaproteobacteria bacterium]
MTVSLVDLKPGDRARVAGYLYDAGAALAAHSGYPAQLMRLGLIPGTEITVQRTAPLGDPMEIRFRGFSLALRPSEAQCLVLELVPDPS